MKLNIGGNQKVDSEWITLDSVDLKTDCLGRIQSLPFKDSSFKLIYCSHVLEHVTHSEIENCLKEIFRCLCPGGELVICVPDVESLLERILHCPTENISALQGYLKILFGSHENSEDCHRTGFNETLLRHYLTKGGFYKINKLDKGIFQDFSWMDISLNLKAVKP